MDDTATPTAGPDKLRALIVDDEAPARDRLRRMLEELHDVAVVGEAANGTEALTRCAALDPDLVLLDVRMPGIDGFAACRRLRALAALAGTPIFLVTAFDDDDVWPEAMTAGATGLLAKPYDRMALRRLLRELSQQPSASRDGAREA